ncbi:MAG: AMP-binding protein, partial [Clostridia bacterium]|nr:AMP-binding protein [Clostridia bacterium]
MTALGTITTMPQLLAYLAQRGADTVCMRRLRRGTGVNADTVEEITYGQFFAQIAQCRAVLVQRRIAAGAHIALLGADSAAWLAAFGALMLHGCTAVPMDPRLPPQQTAQRAAAADVTAVFYDAASAAAAEAIGDAVPGAVLLPFPEETAEAWTDEMLSRIVFPGVGAAALACLLFTSGTTSEGTGGAKAVMFSHRAMAAGICHTVLDIPFTAQLAVMPFHHIAGIASVWNTLYLGAVVCLAEEMKYLFRYLEYLKPDYMLCVPTVLQALLPRLRGAGIYGSARGWNLRMIGCGGAAFPASVIGGLQAQGIRVLQSYGATEAGGIGFETEMTAEHPDTIGRPGPALELRVVGGELWLRSASVMDGYYGDPAATAAVLLLMLFVLPVLIVDRPIARQVEEAPLVLPATPIPAQTQTETGGEDAHTIVRVAVADGQVTEMTMADYLWAVVAAEMPASFELEAMKAQAVTARTYTVWKTESGEVNHPNADVCADIGCCQAFLSPEQAAVNWGTDTEAYTEKIRTAVKETDGQIITYAGEPIQAVFFSSADGRTEDAVAVWGSAVTYLVGV